jgi:hypothetical protein
MTLDEHQKSVKNLALLDSRAHFRQPNVIKHALIWSHDCALSILPSQASGIQKNPRLTFCRTDELFLLDQTYQKQPTPPDLFFPTEEAFSISVLCPIHTVVPLKGSKKPMNT